MEGPYNIIYADPPWQYENQKNCDPRLGGITYPVMPLERIKALPVASLAAKDAALFLWATLPKLPEAFEVITAWGFSYRTCAFVWVKQNPGGNGIYSGLGHWTNGNAELCLFAKRGRPKRIARNIKQIVISPLGRHSQKPDEVRNRIVSLLGNLLRIELFARQRVPGWHSWGLEVASDIQMAA
jgi:N6-adenosine-specific RNA methylase IME4